MIQRQALLRGAQGQQLAGILHQCTQIHRLGPQRQLAGLKTRQVKNVVDQLERMLGAGAHHVEIGVLVGLQPGLAQQVRRPQRAGQRRAQLVGDRGEKDCLAARRLAGGSAGLTLRGHIASQRHRAAAFKRGFRPFDETGSRAGLHGRVKAARLPGLAQPRRNREPAPGPVFRPAAKCRQKRCVDPGHAAVGATHHDQLAQGVQNAVCVRHGGGTRAHHSDMP